MIIKRLAWTIFIPLMLIAGCNKKEMENYNTQSAIDTVMISDMQFHPDTLQINKGGIVIWINLDIVAHTATAFPDEQWDSGTIPTDSSWKMVFKKKLELLLQYSSYGER